MLEVLGIAFAVFGATVLVELLTVILLYMFHHEEEWHREIKIENNWIIYNIMLSLDRGVKMENCIKDFLLENWDYGFAIMGLGEEVYLDGEETATFSQNENVEIDLLLDDILYILVGGIPCSVEPYWKWGRIFP